MTPEASEILARARCDLDDARKILAIRLTAIAARSAYFAAFHAAEALIAERTGKIAKTHSGVRSEFARLLKDTRHHDPAMLAFLGQAYKYKEVSDYGRACDAPIGEDEASKAIAEADAFVNYVAALMSGASDS